MTSLQSHNWNTIREDEIRKGAESWTIEKPISQRSDKFDIFWDFMAIQHKNDIIRYMEKEKANTVSKELQIQISRRNSKQYEDTGIDFEKSSLLRYSHGEVIRILDST